MTCPKCGGTERRSLGPGVWQCQSTIVETYIQLAQDPYLPIGGVRPIDQYTVPKTCMHIYHDTSGLSPEMTTIALQREREAQAAFENLPTNRRAANIAEARERKADETQQLLATIAAFLKAMASNGNPGAILFCARSKHRAAEGWYMSDWFRRTPTEPSHRWVLLTSGEFAIYRSPAYDYRQRGRWRRLPLRSRWLDRQDSLDCRTDAGEMKYMSHGQLSRSQLGATILDIANTNKITLDLNRDARQP